MRQDWEDCGAPPDGIMEMTMQWVMGHITRAYKLGWDERGSFLELGSLPKEEATMDGVVFLQRAGWKQCHPGELVWWAEPGSRAPRQYADAIRMEMNKQAGGGQST